VGHSPAPYSVAGSTEKEVTRGKVWNGQKDSEGHVKNEYGKEKRKAKESGKQLAKDACGLWKRTDTLDFWPNNSENAK